MNAAILFVVVIFSLVSAAELKTAKVKARDKVKGREKMKLNDPEPTNQYIKVESLNVITQIQARFATTLITCKIRNDAKSDQEVTFTATLPDAAFISNFTMLILEKIIIADVKEKAAAKIEYDKAKARGESAGHVTQKPRETNTFQISVNVARNTKVVFNLTYQEILKRVHTVYKHIVNLQPDQPVEQMQVDVYITERGEIRNIKVPKFGPRMGEKTNRELLQMPEEKNYVIQKSIKDKVSNVHITFTPHIEGDVITYGQLVVLYDVNRDKSGGDIEVVNGYFVHFMAPEGLKPGSKHVIFVLDKSGSMEGRKMEQLKDAMKTIVGDLDSADVFNIIMFSDEVQVWKSESVTASSTNIEAAKNFVNSQVAEGSTALNDAVLKSIELLNSGKQNTLTAMVLFMTDGQPTAGETDSNTIVTNVDSANTKKYSINCVAFGEDADYALLQKISTRHRGLARKVYEDSDASLQLTGFYDEIRSPILTEVQITYLNDAVDVNSLVQDQIVNYYDGGEVVTIGRLKNSAKQSELQANVKGKGAAGRVNLVTDVYPWVCPMYANMDAIVSPSFARCCPEIQPMGSAAVSKTTSNRIAVAPIAKCCFPDCCWGYYDSCLSTPPPARAVPPANTAGGFIERMWAYQTIKKYLRQVEVEDASSSSLKQKALDLSLKYHFVTELTSMVVTDPTQSFRPLVDKNRKEKETSVGEEDGGRRNGGKKNSGGGTGTATGSSAGAASETAKGSSATDNANKNVPPPVKPNPQPSPAPNPSKGGGCSLDIVVVIDLSGDTSANSNLVRKLIDTLSSKFSQTSRMAIIFVGASSNGKSTLIQSMVPLVSSASVLKDATRKTASSFTSDLSSLSQTAYSTGGTNVNAKSIIFFTGSQSLQYAKEAVQKLTKTYSNLKTFAVSSGGKQNSKSLTEVTGSPQNSFVSPEAEDLAQALSC